MNSVVLSRYEIFVMGCPLNEHMEGEIYEKVIYTFLFIFFSCLH